MSVDSALLAALKAMEAYLDDVVIVGGWVPHLYGEVTTPPTDAVPLKTRDVDIAVPRRVPERDKPMGTALEDAGFHCDFRSTGIPPISAYVGEHAGEEVLIEFITAAQGRQEGVRSVQRGVTAQELRYVSMLLENKWSLSLAVLSNGVMGGQVWIPTPGAYVVHKALVHGRRRERLKREKDLYYIFYVCDAFPDWHGRIQREISELIEQHPTWLRRCRRDLSQAFETPDSPGVEALLNQRPGTAYAGMKDDQFRQYGWSVMQALLDMMH